MTDTTAVAARYIELVGSHDLGPLHELLADDLVATTGTGTFNKAEWIAALDRLLPVLVRNDVRSVLGSPSTSSGTGATSGTGGTSGTGAIPETGGSSGNGTTEAAVLYDFVTDTEAGAVPCVEWVTVDDSGRIATLTLIVEKANWGLVVAALKVR
jgi:hypothetical protein